MKPLLGVALACAFACSSKGEEGKAGGEGASGAAAAGGAATGAAPDKEKRECAGPKTCAFYEKAGPEFKKGSNKLLPAGFPEPPAGATLCGEAIVGRSPNVYYVIPDDSGVFQHYQTALDAAGWKAEAPPADVPGVLCDQSQDFTKGKEGVGVYVFGSGAFTISYVPPL